MEQFSSNIQQSIRNIIAKEDFVNPKICIKNVTGDNNFMGELYEINLEEEINNDLQTKHIFMKRIVEIKDFKVYSIPEVFAKEAFVYNELLKLYNELENDTNIPNEYKLRSVMSFDETSPEAIILDNIKQKGYSQTHKFEAMTLDIAEKSIEQLAKFHGLSFILERRRPEYFEEKIKSIKQSFVYDKYWDDISIKFTNVSIADLDSTTKERVLKFLPTSLEKYPKYMTGETDSIKCLCHGDYKMNNIMYRRQNEVTDVIPIDYQQIYYGNPIIDLIYFIYASSERSFRKSYLYHLKDYYYSSLETYLKYFKIDLNSIYRKDEFDKGFTECLDYGLMFCLYMYPFFFASDDAEKTDDLNAVVRVDERLKDRMQGVIDDFIEWNIL